MGSKPELGALVQTLLSRARLHRPDNRVASTQPGDGLNEQKHMRIAAFFEAISHALYGGETRPMVARAQSDGTDDTYIFTPDLVNTRRRIVVETKGLVHGHAANLYDRQITGYLLEQLARPSYRFSFVWYRHTLNASKSIRGTDRTLFSNLAARPLVALALPLSAVWAIHQREDDGKTRRNTGNNFSECTVLNATPQYRFYGDTLDALSNLGLDASAYTTSVLRAGPLNIDGHRIKAFPLITVRDRDHTAWFERLAQWEPPKRFEGWY